MTATGAAATALTTPMRPPGGSAARSAVRGDIQGLRAFAVVVVVLDHLSGWPRGGFVGVDVFFVISGFLITSHILRELDRSGRLSLSGFYRRRIRRIAPAATVTIAVTVAVALLVLPRSRAISTAVDGLWAFLFGANWRMMQTGTDYFQRGLPPSPLQHFWSLSVEEQFYFVWPLLAIAVFAVGARVDRSRVDGSRRTAVLVLGAVVAASFAWAWLETASNPTAAYFSTLTRTWELGAGALLAAVILRRRVVLPHLARVLLAWIGLAGLVASIFAIDAASAFPAPAAALPVLATVAVLVAGTDADERYPGRVWPLTNRVSRYLGDISYSLYLWHFPVIVLLAALLPSGSSRTLLIAVVLMAVLSVASYHLVEQPVRRSGWLLPRDPADPRRVRRRTLVAAGAGIAAIAVVCALGAARLVAPAATPAPVAATGCVGAAAAPGAGGDCPRPTSLDASQVVPSIDALADDTAGAYSCWRSQGGPLASCTFGSEGPDAARVAVVGDSHAAALLPAFRDLAASENWSVDTFVGYGCQWMDQAAGSDCDQVADETQQRLLSGGYDLVLTTAARWAIADAPIDAFTARWDAVVATGSRVVVIAAAPTVPDSTFECLARLGADVTSCGAPRADALEPSDRLGAAAAADPHVSLVDLTDLYCDESWCPAVIGGVVVARDAAGHLSGTYAKTLAPMLAERIAKAGA
ncbi:acyltransferase family protein [Agromyces sp. NPDC058110]|uniref:acyltransferase family protein n=1 Tax=Agromyces sp. NPDC058110 TaxID=3346345 RepID=UPI0036D8A9AD